MESLTKHIMRLLKWNAANLSFTPIVHSLLVHALEQVQLFQGIGDSLEDDIEHMYQISARIKSRVSQMKNKDQQALVHSRLEAIASNVEVITNIEERKIARRAQKTEQKGLKRREMNGGSKQA